MLSNNLGKRTGKHIRTCDVDTDTAREMAAIGAVPTLNIDPVGTLFEMAGQVFVSGAEITRDEFLQLIEEASKVDPKTFDSDTVQAFRSQMPDNLRFQRIYTD